ncbi:MAG TPA: hydantoinase B/oxoprolinase family protein [Calditerricola sp.]
MAAEQNRVLDPFTIEIIKESLIAASDEMFYALARTSMSTIIYEVLDYACGLTDDDGRLIAQSNGVTLFQGILTYTVRSVLEKFGKDGLRPGDVVITNDPYTGGGTHLSDVAVVRPIFYKGELVAFAANKAHFTEVGGKDAGSWTTDATEIYQEGLQFPCIKAWEEGRINQALVDLIRANVRTPDMTIGDLYACAAALQVAERRVLEILDKYGVEAYRAAIEDLFRRGRENHLQHHRKLPKGTFEAEDWIDDDGLSDEPIPVRVKVTITDDEFIVDITGTSPQVLGPVNSTLTASWCAARTMYHALVDPHFPANEGCFEPVRLIAPPGTIFSATRPAPVSTYWETMLYLTDLIARALAPHIPERLTAGHFLSVCGSVVSGVTPENEWFILVEPQAGGWGAGVDKDGENGLVCIGDGETYVIPVEVAEHRYPIRVEQYRLNTDEPPGAGRFRGGFGLIRDYRILNPSGAFFTGTFGRHKFRPWGMHGGGDGTNNRFEIYRQGADRPELVRGKGARIPLAAGDLVRLITANGGGYGSPLERDPERVARDVRDGYITPETALRDYGVVVDAGGNIDWLATEAERRRRTAATPAPSRG